MSATHIINKLPIENLKWKSPFERIHGKQPTYEDLRVVGCLSFAANLHPSDKFDSRAKKCIFWAIRSVTKATNYMICKQRRFFTVDMLFFINTYVTSNIPSDRCIFW